MARSSTTFKKGHKMLPGSEKGWIKKGQRLSTQTEFNSSVSENLHPNWVGDNIKKAGVHRWVEKWKGKPQKCEVCGTENSKKFEWANIDHSYKRILEDYIRMCTPCHRKYDIEHNNYLKK